MFYHKDIRNYGSNNLGGGNAGRVLGKKAGLVVMTLDILKVTLVVFLTSFFFNIEKVSIIGGLAAAVRHCFPIFAKFKGGKAVALMYGFLFGMVLFWEYSLWIFLLPLISFRFLNIEITLSSREECWWLLWLELIFVLQWI